MLAVRKVGRLNIKTKMLSFEASVLIGWLARLVSIHMLANQNVRFKVKRFCLRWPTFLTASIIYTTYAIQYKLYSGTKC